MQTTSELFKTILSGTHSKEIKVIVNGVEYGSESIVSLSTYNTIYAENKPMIGSCVSGELSLHFFPGDVVPPRMAEINVLVRVVNGSQESEWIPKGTYYIDTRVVDAETGLYTITGYDSMLKAEQLFLQEGDTGEWPRPASEVVAQIAQIMGVEIDEKTVLKDYMVDYPNDYTCRELLSQIAVAHCGNWTITASGHLRLILLTSLSDITDLGRYVETFESSPSFLPYTKVILWYDDENAFVSGDGAGRALEADLPWATQQIADDVLSAISGFIYHPFSATNAFLDPSVELGDGITVNAISAPLASMDVTYDQLYTADIAAPHDEEIDHEYPYVSPNSRELSRKVTLGKPYYGTRITRDNGLEIIKTEADGTEKSRVILNSDLQAFYNDDGQEALYFDINAGKFRFRGDVEITGGTINVNNNFIVDALGNVVMNGSIKIAGSLTMTGDTGWIKVRYSTDKSAAIPWGWSESWSSSWENTSTEVWAIYSYDGGTSWTSPMLVQGKTGATGAQGPAGSSANIPAWVAAYTASAQFNTLVDSEWVVSMNLYGSKIFGGMYYNLAGTYSLELGDTDGYNAFSFNGPYGLIFSAYDADFGYTTFQAKDGYNFLTTESVSETSAPKGTWDFSKATVTGLSVVFG